MAFPKPPRRSREHFWRFVDRWAIVRAGRPPERNPKIIAILTCIGINLIPTATGMRPLPESLANVPPYFGQVSTAFAALGCFLCVAGLILPLRYRDTGLAIELAGTVLLAAGMLFYADALWIYTTDSQRAYPLGAAVGIGVGSILRAAQIALYVRGRRLAEQLSAREPR